MLENQSQINYFESNNSDFSPQQYEENFYNKNDLGKESRTIIRNKFWNQISKKVELIVNNDAI